MDDLSMLGTATFDLVHQPVSTCYVPRLAAVYREIGRVLRPGGVYISQHKQPTSLQVTHRDAKDRYVLGIEYYQSGALPEVPDRSYREPGTVEYLHSWGELVGELCRTGFVLEDLDRTGPFGREAPPGHFAHSRAIRSALRAFQGPATERRRPAKRRKEDLGALNARDVLPTRKENDRPLAGAVVVLKISSRIGFQQQP